MTDIDVTKWFAWPQRDDAPTYSVLGQIGNHTWTMAECDNRAEAERIAHALAALPERDATIARVRDAIDNSPIYRPDHATYGDDAWDNIETVDLARILRALDPQEGQ